MIKSVRVPSQKKSNDIKYYKFTYQTQLAPLLDKIMAVNGIDTTSVLVRCPSDPTIE